MSAANYILFGVTTMTKTLIAVTKELDDLDLAINEIMQQLQPETSFLRNSLAIVACHYEFVETDILKTLHEKLSCEMVGAISMPTAAGDQSDLIMLSIMVITSDEAIFSTVLTDTVQADPVVPLKNAFTQAAAFTQDRPSLILTYCPFIFNPDITGDLHVRTLSEISGNVPCFGTISTDGTMHAEKCLIIHNGDTYLDKCCISLVYGLNPKFYTANISPNKIISPPAMITKSKGNTLMEVNNRSIKEYFTNLGVYDVSKEIFGMLILPFIIDYKDGSSFVAKTFTQLSPEGYAMFAAEIPEGCTIQVAANDKEDVLAATEIAIKQILAENPNATGLLAYSCVSRYMALGRDALAEMDLVKNKLLGNIPFLMASSGGEICPTDAKDGQHVNRFHNNTIAFCVF